MSPPKLALEDAVVAITGAGRGVGRATAEQFARRGAIVCLADLDGGAAADAASRIGSRAHAFHVDVRSRESFEDFVSSVRRCLGPLDVLVNNAGVMPSGRFLDEEDAVTDAVLAVNLFGAVHGMRLVLPEMIDRGRGHVVNVASLLGRSELPGLASYVASKHALVGLSAAVRAELRGTGVTLTAVLPSIINTELSRGIGVPSPLKWLARVQPEDVAAAIVESCDSRPREVAVPRWLGLYPALRPLMPDRLEETIRRLLGDDAAIRALDGAQRQVDAERVVRQTHSDGT